MQTARSGIDRFDELVSRQRPIVMGILNVTPDSFYDGGSDSTVDESIERGIALIDAGADIVDVGGESTRPPGADYGSGAATVTEEEELARVAAVIAGISAMRPDTMVSIDTMKPGVARHALSVGATMINDVSAGTFDQSIWDVAAEGRVPCVLMHGLTFGDRRPIEQFSYVDVVEEVHAFLTQRISMARGAGVERVIADVGIGFSKGVDQNLEILRHYERFADLGVPTLLGASRKSFIGRITGGLPVSQRIEGSLATAGHAWERGASILRVHDVGPTVRYIATLRALRKQ